MEVYYNALAFFRELRAIGARKHGFSEVRDSVDSIMEHHQKLLNAREYAIAYRLMNYCRDLNGSADGDPIKLNFTPDEVAYICSHLNLFPSSIHPFISEDADLNRILVDCALRTGCHHDGDHRDSRHWAKVSERLGVLQDENSLMHIVNEMHESLYARMLGDCIVATSKLKTLSPENQGCLANVLIEQFKRIENGNFNFHEDHMAPIINTAHKFLSPEVFKTVIDHTPLSKIQKQDYFYKIAIVFAVDFDKDKLIYHALKAYEPGNLKDYSKDSVSIITFAFMKHPEEMYQGLRKKLLNTTTKGNAEKLVGDYATLVKYMLLVQVKKPYGIEIKISDDVLEKAISLIIETTHTHSIKGVEGILGKYCGLKPEQYISLDAYRPYRREALEKDLNL